TVFIGVSNSDGVVTTTLTSPTVGPQVVTAVGDNIPLTEPVTVTFTTGPVDTALSSIIVLTETVIADGAAATLVTATWYDSYNHPLPGREVSLQTTGQLTLTQPITLTDALGQVQAALSSTEVQTATVTAVNHTDNITLTYATPVSFVAGPIDAAHSTIVISPTVLLADGLQIATIAANLYDISDHPAADRRVQLVTTGSGGVITPTGVITTNENGGITFTLASTAVEIIDVSLRDVDYDVSLAVGQVEFVYGAADADSSTLTTNKETITADGVDEAVLTATLRDANGHPIPDKQVTIQAEAGTAPLTITQPITLTNAQGQVAATVSATTPQTVVMTAVDQTDTITLTQTVTLTFVPAGPDANNSDIVITPTTAIADNAQTITIDAMLRDVVGNPISARNMELVVGGSGNNISPANIAATDANGRVIWTLVSTRAEIKTLAIRDTITGDTLLLDPVTFVAGPVDAA
ncbi:MAG: hypothetical protein GY803_02715, partial [Chloroflexi bacterium]|nr:hypothetical protein [Chloroflexota bacterium]